MNNEINRRNFLKKSAVIPVIAASGVSLNTKKSYSQTKIKRIGNPSIKVSCCAYSYRRYLTNGEMTLDDFLDLAAGLDFDGVELTSYYFPNYPDKPDDEYIYHLKRKAFLLGLDISGSAARNNFTNPDKSKRKADIEHVKMWIECASKLGAPAIRIFGGNGIPEGHTEEEATEWVAECVEECAEFGRKYGVIAALENHGGFPETSEQVMRILRKVNSDWLGVNLDTNGFKVGEPYEQIAEVAPYAVTCHLKPSIRGEKVDINKIISILRNAGYRGYIPIEFSGKDDPKTGVPKLLDEIRKALG